MKEIMNIISENGYESFVVGGYVRDYLLGIQSYDIDISTNAPINKIIKMFNGKGKAYKDFYAYHIDEGEYSYDITTYRKELEYNKNKPVKLQVARTLGEDLLRRDFTINTFAIDKEGRFVDILGSKKDLDARLIKVVGDTEKKLTEDKTRILRAIRFFCTMDFDLDTNILNFLKEHPEYLKDIPRQYVKKELDKIFDSNNFDKFFYILKDYDIGKYLDISFDKVHYAYDKYGIWAQVETTLPFSKEEKKKIDDIKALVKYGDIKFLQLYTYSSDVILNAAGILGITNKVKDLLDITKLHSVIEINSSINIFYKYVDVKDVKRVYKLVEKRIMEGTLNNNEKDIEEFIKDL